MTDDKLEELEALLARHAQGSSDLASRRVCAEALRLIRAQAEEIARYREAMTPSGATKAAYHGEFSFEIVEQGDSEMCEVSRKVYVPWTTVKEIMGRIHARCQP